MNNKFFLNSIGVATIIFAVAFLIRSVQPANAAPKPAEFLTEGTSQIGKYQMQLSEGLDATNKFYYNILIWNTETGVSYVYGWNYIKKEWESSQSPVPNY